MLRFNRRELATSLATRLGVLSLLERFSTRPMLLVLVYHRVMRVEDCEYDTDVVEATPDQFHDQMVMLRKRHSIADPEELIDLARNPSKIRHFRVAITFDDGYRDNYDNAFPILKSQGIRAAFFLPTYFVGTNHLPWWDRMAYAIRRCGKSAIELRRPTQTTRFEIDPNNPILCVRKILKAYKKETDVTGFLEAVEEACGTALPTHASDRQFMSWTEAKEMQDAGMSMGSHTHSHNILGDLPRDVQEKECVKSRDLLKEHGLDPKLFAYPVGNPQAFSETTIDCAKRAGYVCAFSNYGGLNLPDDLNLFDIKRFGMSTDQTAAHLRMRLALANRRPSFADS